MIVLNFHGLGEPGPAIEQDERPYWVAIERFEAILAFVAPRAEAIAITFDDGNASDVVHALPLLVRHGLKADFFVVSERIGQSGYLSAADILDLRRAGMGIGSHGMRHVKWTSLPDDELALHVSRSLQALSDILAEPMRSVAIPFGAYDRRVLAVLRREGVTRAYTSDRGPVLPGRWLVARNTVPARFTLDDIRELAGKYGSPLALAKAYLRQFKKTGFSA